MKKTFADIMDVDGWLSAVAPNDLPCLTKVLFIVCKDNEIVKGCDGTAARGEGQVSGFSPRFRAVIRCRHVDANEKKRKKAGAISCAQARDFLGERQ